MTKYQTIIYNAIRTIVLNEHLRHGVLKSVESKIRKETIDNDPYSYPYFMQDAKANFVVSLIRRVSRNLDKGYISRTYAKTALDNFFSLFTRYEDESKLDTLNAFIEKYGRKPPAFLVISPGKACNLHCKGCYAASGAKTKEKLPFEVFDKLVKQSHDLWQSRFLVLSGGEPLMYRDGGHTILDIAEKHHDMFIMFYTNGVLITDELAARMEELGNMTPAISVEGFENETDERRGKGIYRRILQAADNLRKHGVPFGISVTATRSNHPVLVTDDFYDFWFEEQGAVYMWLFHLMPIGRAKDTISQVITPQQRVELYDHIKKYLDEKKYPVADFWNSGILAGGCIAYGRDEGYLYIDWDGKITPCVFVPYYQETVYDLFKKGKTLSDALTAPLFERGRRWQYNYGYPSCTRYDQKNYHGNMLMPCSIRDHYDNFRRNIMTPDTQPEDMYAAMALEDPEYYQAMVQFDEELEKLTEPNWKAYLEMEGLTGKKKAI